MKYEIGISKVKKGFRATCFNTGKIIGNFTRINYFKNLLEALDMTGKHSYVELYGSKHIAERIAKGMKGKITLSKDILSRLKKSKPKRRKRR